MEMTQYQKDLVRMWDSLRTDYKGSHNCCPILCEQCPLNKGACSGDGFTHTIFNAEKAIEIVTQWAKEHPIVTNEDKFKEVWGKEPKVNGTYICPPVRTSLLCSKNCGECRKTFWGSEYKPPKEEGE